MTRSSSDRNLVQVSPLARWGPMALVLGTVLALLAVVVVRSPDEGSTTAAGSRRSQPTSPNAVRKATDNPLLPVTYQAAEKSGDADGYDWGQRCDVKSGRIKIESVYAPPCVPVWNGKRPWRNQGGNTVKTNGGATSPGVDKDTITVVYYVPGPTDLMSLAQSLGVLDPTSLMAKTLTKLVTAANDVYETYARKVEVKVFSGTGDGKDPTAARADAIKVATEEHAFASIGGPTQTTAYQDTLAEHHVLCIGCSAASTVGTYQNNAPYNWGTNATPEQALSAALQFALSSLAGRPAVHAGDPGMRKHKRVFGVVYYEQDPPIYGSIRSDILRGFADRGLRTAINLTYVLDTDTLNTQAQTIIGQLKAAGVTTVVHTGDPLMPINLTEEATRQNYHPEWMITGTTFTDSTSTGRLTDQKQWAHAFGVSSLPARMDPEQSVGWRFYKWYFGQDPQGRKSIPLVYPAVQALFTGIQGAGPNLTPDTFAGGLFSYPPTGDGVTAPRVSYGSIGADGKVDYIGVDDYTIVWWDPSVKGPSEQGAPGTGMWAYVNGGKRYLRDKAPGVRDDALFNPKGAVTVYKKPPTKQASWPAWPGSPADTGG